MSNLATFLDRSSASLQRRTIRMLRPRVQLRLAAYVLVVSAGFLLLFAFNSWAAYGRIFEATLSTAPAPFSEDIGPQTRNYVSVSLVLLVGYSLTVLAVTIAYVHRLIGPTVAMERHVRALERGDFTSRLALRDGDLLYADVAHRLNGLADRLEARDAHRQPLPRA